MRTTGLGPASPQSEEGKVKRVGLSMKRTKLFVDIVAWESVTGHCCYFASEKKKEDRTW
jgi:hypothetical protein